MAGGGDAACAAVVGYVHEGGVLLAKGLNTRASMKAPRPRRTVCLGWALTDRCESMPGTACLYLDRCPAAAPLFDGWPHRPRRNVRFQVHNLTK